MDSFVRVGVRSIFLPLKSLETLDIQGMYGCTAVSATSQAEFLGVVSGYQSPSIYSGFSPILVQPEKRGISA